MIYEEAGSDADLHEARLVDIIDSDVAQGHALMNRARAALDQGDANAAEAAARAALASYASALDWAEDGPREADVHARLDAAGRWVRRELGCLVPQEGSDYYITCPVRLAHRRVGFSIGGRAKRLCALCGQDISECPHMRGVAYLVPGGIADLEWCRVCLSRDACDHLPTEFYRVPVVAIVTDLVVDEISLVDKPAHPAARVLKTSIDISQLRDALGPTWTPGMPVNCDFCLSDCSGLVRGGFGGAV